MSPTYLWSFFSPKGDFVIYTTASNSSIQVGAQPLCEAMQINKGTLGTQHPYSPSPVGFQGKKRNVPFPPPSQATGSGSTARFMHGAHSTAAPQHSPIPPSAPSPEQRSHPQQHRDVQPHPPQRPPKTQCWDEQEHKTCAWQRGYSLLSYSPGAVVRAWVPYEPGFFTSLDAEGNSPGRGVGRAGFIRRPEDWPVLALQPINRSHRSPTPCA